MKKMALLWVLCAIAGCACSDDHSASLTSLDDCTDNELDCDNNVLSQCKDGEWSVVKTCPNNTTV